VTNPQETTITFSDGMVIVTSGELRVIRKKDGYYVVGRGMCCPVDTYEDGQKLITELGKR